MPRLLTLPQRGISPTVWCLHLFTSGVRRRRGYRTTRLRTDHSISHNHNPLILYSFYVMLSDYPSVRKTWYLYPLVYVCPGDASRSPEYLPQSRGGAQLRFRCSQSAASCRDVWGNPLVTQNLLYLVSCVCYVGPLGVDGAGTRLLISIPPRYRRYGRECKVDEATKLSRRSGIR